MLTNACKALAKHWVSRHHPTFGAAYILDDTLYTLLGLRHYTLPVDSGTWHKKSIIEQRRHGLWLAAGNIVSTVHQHLHMDRQGRLNPFDLHNIPSCHVSSSCIDMSNQIESNPDHTHIQCCSFWFQLYRLLRGIGSFKRYQQWHKHPDQKV